jgi:hypothetical protein
VPVASLFFACRLALQRWAEIAHHLPGRSDQGVKNRFNNHLRHDVDNQQQLSAALAAPGGQHGCGRSAPSAPEMRVLARAFVPQQQTIERPALMPPARSCALGSASAAACAPARVRQSSFPFYFEDYGAHAHCANLNLWTTPMTTPPLSFSPASPAHPQPAVVGGIPIPEPMILPPPEASARIVRLHNAPGTLSTSAPYRTRTM